MTPSSGVHQGSSRRLAGAAVIVLGLVLAGISVLWMVGWSTSGDVINPVSEAYAFLYVGGGACLIGAVVAIFLVPMWLGRRKGVGGAIFSCFVVSVLGAFASFVGGIALVAN
jgi:hypothetical protein